MSFRTKVFRTLRRISGLNEGYTNTPESVPTVEPKDTIQPQLTNVAEEKQASTANLSDTSTLPDLVLYGRPSCPYCARVDRAIVTMGIEDEITKRHTGSGTEWRADLRKRTGSTQVPCLFINGEPMFESLDIIAWMKANLA